LFEQGLRLTPELLGARSVAIHDSCPDRRHGIIAASVRSLCDGLEIRELGHNRQHSLCCGLGKLLFVTAPAASERLRSGRLGEFNDSGAEVLLSYCMSCAQAFQYPARDGADSTSTPIRALHYLEPLFGCPVDWAALRTDI
jgi:Fe-S oxidoreductase